MQNRWDLRYVESPSREAEVCNGSSMYLWRQRCESLYRAAVSVHGGSADYVHMHLWQFHIELSLRLACLYTNVLLFQQWDIILYH